jgi:hypothetical protein
LMDGTDPPTDAPSVAASVRTTHSHTRTRASVRHWVSQCAGKTQRRHT